MSPLGDMLAIRAQPRVTDGAHAVRVSRAPAAVIAWLAARPAGLAGAVHSVFPQAVNLALAGRLLALHGPGLLRAPFALALDRWPLPYPVAPGDPVTLEPGGLRVGQASLLLSAATQVSLRAHRGVRPCSAYTLKRTPEPTGHVPSVAAALRAPHGAAATRRLADAIARTDPAAFAGEAAALVGLGEGLTPAGDDVLVGALAALHAAGHPLATDRDVAAGLRHAARTRTTDLGREFLLHAVDGEFAECVLDAVSGDRDRERRGVTALLAHGASSGADTLHGLRVATRAVAAGGPAPPGATTDRGR